MRIKTEYTYESEEGTSITVILETSPDSELHYRGSETLNINRKTGHLNALRSILGIPNAPSDQEMDHLEEYFNGKG